MTNSLDEVATEYGLLAEAVRHPPDWSSVTYRLRKEARWHDGQPVTPEDVVWTFENLTKLNPNYRFYYRHVTKAEKTGEREVTFTFDQRRATANCRRSSASSCAAEALVDRQGRAGKRAQRDSRTLEPPLGSGPYRVKSVRPRPHGRLRARARLLGQGRLNVQDRQGQFRRNPLRIFPRPPSSSKPSRPAISTSGLRSSCPQLGDSLRFPRPPRRPRHAGRISHPRARGVMQAFVPNLRRDKFKDPRCGLRSAMRSISRT
jgi:microcin C transport system substrate-binding protein